MKQQKITLYLEGTWEKFSDELLKSMTPEILKLYTEEADKQKKHQTRQNRCQVSGISGKIKRCMKSCDDCPYVKGYSYDPARPRLGTRTGGVLSLDFFEDIGKPIPTPASFETTIEYKELIDALYAAINTLKEIDRRIAALLLEDLTERDIATIIGREQPFVHYHKAKIIIPALREKLKDFGNPFS